MTTQDKKRVRPEIRALIARGERTQAIHLALDHGLREAFVRGEFETWWPDGITEEPAQGWNVSTAHKGSAKKTAK